MSDFLTKLNRIQSEFQNEHYEACIRECGSVVEKGLRDLYNSLGEYLRDEGLENQWTEMHDNFKIKRESDFEFEKSGLGGLLLFTQHTKFWERLRIMCTSNLSFINMINWHRLRTLRNAAVHHNGKFSRNDAMEMMFYTKVFLYDCELIEGMENPSPVLLDTDCIDCGHHINREWNYCPNCASEIKQSCHNCHRILDPSFRICPFCDTPRMCKIDHSDSAVTYKRYAEAVWADWEVTPLERQWLNTKRLELGLSLKEAGEIEQRVIPVNYHTFLTLIEAVNIDGVIDDTEAEFLHNKAAEYKIKPDVANTLIDSARKQPKRIRKSILGMSF